MSATSWDRLPAELRYQIIRYLPELGTKWASFTSVSREWQSVLEPLNFARINLSVSRLDDPHGQALLFSRRKEIKYIWFRIELEEYDCTLCANDTEDVWGISMTDNQRIITAFEKLFAALEKWEACNNLMLDISIYSPSDNQHYFKHLTFCPDSTSDFDQCTAVPRNAQERSAIDDPAHGWIPGQEVITPNDMAIEKTFEEIMGEGPFDDDEAEMAWWQHLPTVPAVKSLLLRQQTRRRWKPVALSHLLPRFSRLRKLHYEPWREFTDLDLHTSKQYAIFIDSLRDTSLQEVVLFSNNNESYAKNFHDHRPVQIPRFNVSRKVAHLSMQLVKLSASFIVDAGYFFEACKAFETWPRLKCLALTMQALTDQVDVREVNNILRDAASTALRMPELETLELWNGKPGYAMLFGYQREGNGRFSTLTIRGTSHFELEDTTRQAWELVAQTQHGGHLRIQRSDVDRRLIRCHGDAINQLELLIEVIRPVSLQQILAEPNLETLDSV